MAVTVHRFQKAYPEFKETEYALVQEKLNAAELRINGTVFGDLEDQAIMLQAAHLLSISPHGEKVRLQKDSHETIYSKELWKMKRDATLGLGRYI
jgi:hypothetical protein